MILNYKCINYYPQHILNTLLQQCVYFSLYIWLIYIIEWMKKTILHVIIDVAHTHLYVCCLIQNIAVGEDIRKALNDI